MSRTAVVVMGVAGCGKSTIARMIADRLGWPVLEGDDLHPAANVDKMSRGIPLTDEDRWPWLRAVRDHISATDGDLVVTCSALRRAYRDVLREADALVLFVHLAGTFEVIEERMSARTGHFMPLSLLRSQLDILQPLEPDEHGVVVQVEMDPDEIVATALKTLHLVSELG